MKEKFNNFMESIFHKEAAKKGLLWISDFIGELHKQNIKMENALKIIDEAIKSGRMNDVSMINHTQNKIETVHDIVKSALNSCGTAP